VAPPGPVDVPFAIAIPRRPPSANRGPNAKFTAAVVAAAGARFVGPLLRGPLYARIFWFHKYKTTEGDADNIAKRLLDALKGVVYPDDHLITHCLAARIDATLDMEISQAGVDANVFQELLQLLGDPSVRDILYVEVGKHAGKAVSFGRVG
jgi:Holliday junction resolvase RusA-like endonuclease